ncbi:MAG: 50S ribosomal protein L28 [Candidatus Nealsonbacteria bacterium]|nr:MAG: 50S ribosomal protein L28 [Candidatus Nealsonbacteria bacterium]
MAKVCSICGKGSRVFGKRKKLRGKYNPTVKRRKYPNLQWVFIPKDIKKEKFKPFRNQRVLACTKCIKALGKRK